jgi:hypothetical protein
MDLYPWWFLKRRRRVARVSWARDFIEVGLKGDLDWDWDWDSMSAFRMNISQRETIVVW